MRTPSRSSYGSRSHSVPWGHTTSTSNPAQDSARASCQTRRSNGTERFSSRTTTLPSDADIVLSAPPLDGVRKADEVDDAPSVRLRQRVDGLRRARADDADLGVPHNLAAAVCEQRREV